MANWYRLNKEFNNLIIIMNNSDWDNWYENKKENKKKRRKILKKEMKKQEDKIN